MINIGDLFSYRDEFLKSCLDEDKTLSENQILNNILPSLFENKLIDSEDINEAYFFYGEQKINAFRVNDSGERLQVFIINEESINFDAIDSDISVSIRKTYDDFFSKPIKFIKNSIKGYFNSEDIIQESDPLILLNSLLSTSHIEEIDVIEVFLISLTASISKKGTQPDPREFTFTEEKIQTSFSKDRQRHIKEILVVKRLIDLNYLYTVDLLKGKGLELNIVLEDYFGTPIEVLTAATGKNFESFLCVLPAEGLSKLYQRENTRLLEKNVRSFLQFTGTNKGMKKTIKSSPEKFIAFNNGLTITATGKETIESENKLYLKSLKDFQIVNGGQTTASLYFSNKEGIPLSGINVMAKINVVSDANEEELRSLVSEISLYSNTQTKVSKVDLNSQNEQLARIKKFSISVLSPSNKKWFFENKKGEYKTELLLTGRNKRSRFEQEYPKERLISAKELGIYFMAWGQKPYLVKLGGDKIFRYFLEELEGDGEKLKPKLIDRDFYEDLISRVILFRNLEKIHGDSRSRNNIGSLRSAVIPYTLSVLNKYTEDTRAKRKFNMSRIWKSEKIELDLEQYLYKLMILVNDLIKKYSKTDDYGSYAKKESLWLDIADCKEIKQFISTAESQEIINNYTISSVDAKATAKKTEYEINFEYLQKSARLFDLGEEFFIKLLMIYDDLSNLELRKVEKIRFCLQRKEDPDEDLINSIILVIERLKIDNKSKFNDLLLKSSSDSFFEMSLNFILDVFNDCITNKKNILSEFKKIEKMAAIKGTSFSSVFCLIGEKIEKNELISIRDIFNASFYVRILKNSHA